MKANVKWHEGLAMIATADSGHAVVMDGPPDMGGQNLGPRPMEMLLYGIGGCSTVDVLHILKKSRQNVTDCQVEIGAERADTEPKVFTKIHLHFIVEGHQLKESHVKRAVELSAEKYCSASIMLQASVDITHTHEIREAGAE